MSALQRLQDKAGALGTVQKRHNGYWLVPEGEEPHWLGESPNAAERTLGWLALMAENAHYHRLGVERYGMPEWSDPDLSAWREEEEWLAWWEKTKNLTNAD